MLNKVMLIGRLGKDPELAYSQAGMAICKFSLATSDYSKAEGQKTEWHNVVCFGKVAENCNQYLGKGRQCYVEGKISTSSWDGNDGQKKYKTEIISSSVQFLSTKNENQSGNYQQQNQQNAEPVQNDFVGQNGQEKFTYDDIPF